VFTVVRNNMKELLDTMVLVRVQCPLRVGGNEVGCHTIVSRVGINVLRNGVMVKHVQLVCTELIGEWEEKAYTTGSLRRETLRIPIFSPSLRVAQGVKMQVSHLGTSLALLNSCGFHRSLEPTSI